MQKFSTCKNINIHVDYQTYDYLMPHVDMCLVLMQPVRKTHVNIQPLFLMVGGRDPVTTATSRLERPPIADTRIMS